MRLEYFKDVNLVGVAPCSGTIYLDGCGGALEVSCDGESDQIY